MRERDAAVVVEGTTPKASVNVKAPAPKNRKRVEESAQVIFWAVSAKNLDANRHCLAQTQARQTAAMFHSHKLHRRATMHVCSQNAERPRLGHRLQDGPYSRFASLHERGRAGWTATRHLSRSVMCIRWTISQC